MMVWSGHCPYCHSPVCRRSRHRPGWGWRAARLVRFYRLSCYTCGARFWRFCPQPPPR
jgi:hypothetical protein